MYKMSSRLQRQRGNGGNLHTSRTNICGGDKKAGLVPHATCTGWTHRAYHRGNNTNYRNGKMILCENWKTWGWITMNPTQGIAAKHQSARIGLPNL